MASKVMKTHEPLTKETVKNWELAKIKKYLSQWAAYERSKSGHFPDCKGGKCECEKFFLSND